MVGGFEMIWQKVAGLSGSVAVGLGAYGAHGFKPENKVYEKFYDTANKYHLLHSVLLCTAPLTKRPNLFGGIEEREREREREREKGTSSGLSIFGLPLSQSQRQLFITPLPISISSSSSMSCL